MRDGRTEVLYLAPWVDLGGSDKGTIDWFAGIDRSRFAPSLITTQRSPNRWLYRVEPHAEEVWVLPDLMVGDAMPEFILGFVESRGVEIVHVMNSRLGYDLLPDLATLERSPALVAQLHAEELDHGGYVSYAAARYAQLIDRFSVISEHLAGTLRDRYGVPEERIEVIRLGADARGEFDPAQVEPIAGVGESAPAILWPGRLVEQKDPLLTLEVAHALRARGVAFELHIVGDGWLRDEVHARAGELGLDGVVRFHPPTQEIARWMAAADVTLMTSQFEGVPYVVYESLAMQVPVVAPALPGIAEVVDASCGVLVDPRDDVDAYVAALAGLLGDADERGAMGKRARARMLESFTIENASRAHDSLYERLLDERPLAPAPPAPSAPPTQLSLPRDPLPERSVAVVIPCHGHGRHLDACVASVRAQTLPAAQIVVVDDASPDAETAAALERLERDGDVTVVRLAANGGPGAARNRGVDRVTSSYVLFVDADDLLLPEAIDELLARLEESADDVAFAYPNILHFGNRHDYDRKPDWNLFLLTFEKFCAVTALFDARVFEHGVAFDEDLREGHEDWDLVLQIAERGGRGVRAHGPTFLYRKEGFSRVDAQHLARRAYADELRGRHGALYYRIEEIKAQWSPAVSLVLLGGGALPHATTSDLEVREANAAQALAQARAAARGTFVAVVAPEGRVLVERRDGVEQIVRALQGTDAAGFGVLADVEGTPHRLALLGDEDGELVALAWRRSGAVGASRPAELGVGASLLWDIAWAFEERVPLQWRALGSAA
jgi:glycosyltransferase involved in cell wall biosynthesis/GT2 family glycosyltransferase